MFRAVRHEEIKCPTLSDNVQWTMLQNEEKGYCCEFAVKRTCGLNDQLPVEIKIGWANFQPGFKKLLGNYLTDRAL